MLDRESPLQRAQFLHHENARLIGLEEPLVGVQPDRIGALDPAQQPLALLRDDREAPVRGVHVQPDPFSLAEVGHRFEGVDGPGAGRPGVGACRDGVESGGAVVGDGAREGRHVQAEPPVGRDHADALRANADDPGRADVGAVALVAHVHGRALGVAGLFPGGDEGVEAGRRAPAREQPARGLRVAEPVPDPVEDDQLELARTARGQPGALVDLVPRGHEISQHPRPGGRCGDEPEEPGVIDPRRNRQDLSGGALQDLGRGTAALGRVLRQLSFELLPEVSLPGAPFGQAFDPLHDEFGRLAREVEHHLRRHPETVPPFVLLRVV